jgi:membrane fusion protein (multidrug efflux system)
VKVGPRTKSDWVITSGLKAGENVVVEGLQKIKSGMPVTAKPWTAPAAAAAVTPGATAAPSTAEAKPEGK